MINVGRDGRAFLCTFAFPRACVPRFSLRVPAFLYNIFFAFPCALAFLFPVPTLLSQWEYSMCGWGATHHTCAVCVWTDQACRVNSPLRHYTPSSRVLGVRVYTGGKLVWGQTRVSSINPPLPPLLSVHVITVSSLHSNGNLAFLFFCIPCSCIKFAFPCALVPKITGTRERKTRNARPSLNVGL